MKKLFLILVVLCVVFMGCSNPAGGEVWDGPTAALQGTWYLYGLTGSAPGVTGPVIYCYLEFSGNTIRDYRYVETSHPSQNYDHSGTFTTDGTVITVTLYITDYWWYFGVTEPFYGTYTSAPYTIGERTILGVTYPDVLSFGGHFERDYLGEATFIKLDTPPQQ